MTYMERYVMIALLICCFGCDKNGEFKRASVSGVVTLDGVPVAEGSIIFRPIDGTQGPMAGAVIQNGHYAIDRVKGLNGRQQPRGNQRI